MRAAWASAHVCAPGALHFISQIAWKPAAQSCMFVQGRNGGRGGMTHDRDHRGGGQVVLAACP